MADLQLNSYNPSCAVNQCLQQVVGSIDGNPLAQYSACTSTFGAPVISTVTPSVEVIFSTLVDTVSYTDIVVSVSTTFSIYEETTTLSTDVPETTTETTSTTTTTTDTVTAATVTPVKHKKRGGCKPRTTSASTHSFASYPVPNNSSSASHSGYPIISASSYLSSYSFGTSSFSTATYSSTSSASSTSESSSAVPSTSSSSVPAIPIASYCSDLAEYSSACACIDAVSTTSIVTAATPTSVSTILSTESVSVPSVSVSVVTIVITSGVTTVETETLTATETTTDVLTETVTSTYTPTQSPHLKITTSSTTARIGRYITFGSCSNGAICLQYDYQNTGVSIAGNFAVSDAGVWSLRDQPLLTAYIYPATSGTLSAVYFVSSATASSAGDTALTCTVSAAGGLTCQGQGASSTYVYDTMISCGAWIYMVPASRYSVFAATCATIGTTFST
ncbi:hypothetical protein F4781DRAFT_275976 [Annulohypoxylon bovei var. microspora]|nr:hypothetical protein F4781DRAFT_275976 [Annulohypoxylon bovei var. microspora]